MPTPRKATAPTAAAIDAFCAHFDDLFCRVAERTALRQYLIGLLLPREHNKALTVLASLVPGAERQRLHHFLHDAPWDHDALNRRRLSLWQAHPPLGPHANGVLIIDETGDRKRGHGIVLAANQYIGKLGHTANGVVAVTSHWADGTRHVPLGVKPYRPASRLPEGKADPAFATKPALAWDLIEEAREARVPFRVVVADCVYGENPKLESWRCGPTGAPGRSWRTGPTRRRSRPPRRPSDCPRRSGSGRCGKTATARTSCGTWPSWNWARPTAPRAACGWSPPPTIRSSSEPTRPGSWPRT
jgi:SRSO17 transposase